MGGANKTPVQLEGVGWAEVARWVDVGQDGAGIGSAEAARRGITMQGAVTAGAEEKDSTEAAHVGTAGPRCADAAAVDVAGISESACMSTG